MCLLTHSACVHCHRMKMVMLWLHFVLKTLRVHELCGMTTSLPLHIQLQWRSQRGVSGGPCPSRKCHGIWLIVLHNAILVRLFSSEHIKQPKAGAQQLLSCLLGPITSLKTNVFPCNCDERCNRAKCNFYLKMHQKLLGGWVPPGPAGWTSRLTLTVPSDLAARTSWVGDW